MKLPKKLGKRLYEEDIGEIEQIVYGLLLFIRGFAFLLVRIIVGLWDLGLTLTEEEEKGIRHWKKKKKRRSRRKR